MSSRRQFLATGAGLAAGVMLADQLLVTEALAHARDARAMQPPPPLATLTAGEGAAMEAIAARIIPTTTTPGAREAGVIHFMDRALASFQKQDLPMVRRELAALERRVRREGGRAATFATLPPERQDAMLIAMEKGDFFGLCRFLTMVGMFANPTWGGNKGEVGWKLLGFEMHASYAPPFGYYDAEVMQGKRT